MPKIIDYAEQVHSSDSDAESVDDITNLAVNALFIEFGEMSGREFLESKEKKKFERILKKYRKFTTSMAD